MWGSDIWNLYGTEGLVKRTPTVTRQQRRRARQQVDMVSHKKRTVLSYYTLEILGSILKSLCSPRNGSFEMSKRFPSTESRIFPIQYFP